MCSTICCTPQAVVGCVQCIWRQSICLLYRMSYICKGVLNVSFVCWIRVKRHHPTQKSFPVVIVRIGFLTISVRCKWYIEKKEWIIIKSKKFLTSKWESLLSYMLWPHLKYQCHSHNGWNLIVISVWNFRATLLSIYIRFL